MNRGAGYTRVTGVSQLKPGDLVMVAAGSQASIVYTAGCVVAVEVGSVYVVQPESACTLGVVTTDPTPYLIGAGVIGGGVAAGVLLSQQGSSKPASP